MKMLEAVVHTSLANAFGWTIFHSLWQGAIAALIVGTALLRTHSPRIRYAAGSLALLATFFAFGITLFLSIPIPPATPTSAQIHFASAAADTPSGAPISAGHALTDLLPWLTPFWIAGMCLFHVRSFIGWTASCSLRGRGVCVPPDGWQRRVDELRDRLRVTRPVLLLETAVAQSPAVIGYLRPVILAPIGMLTGMPAGQVESILIHELAHVRRHDYLANLVQMIVEGFLFYHPAVWWISHVIRAERENCCDDLVVGLNGNAREYATALTVLEQHRQASGRLALAATGGALTNRIRRLLYAGYTPRSFLAPSISAGVLVLIGALALGAWQATPQARPGGNPQPATLAIPWTKWLNNDVAYIITEEERSAFRALTTDDEREQFVEQFWERRNPTPGSAENPFKLEHYRRIAYANAHFGGKPDLPGWKTDRGRIYITFGPPDEIDSHPDGVQGMPPYEDWLYRFIQGIGGNVKIEFIDNERNGAFHMAMDPNPAGGVRVVNPNQQ